MIRFYRWTAAILLLCAMLSPALGGAVRAQDDAQAQIEQTAAAMLALKSFHFELETTAGTTSFQDAFELRSVSGDVVRPSSFQAEVAVKLAIVSLTLDVISVDGNTWVKNPIGGDDSFIQVTGGDSDFQLPPTILLNPDQLVGQALKYLDDPQLGEPEELDGQQMTVVTGTFDPSKLIGGGTPIADLEEFSPSSQPLDVKAWIDDQDRLVRIDFSGPLFAFEEGSGRLVRSITFSNFDNDVTISQPD
ncbi:MAG TPA: LppX_LprAFG lipoprotein [Thermomicrobiales bacterium]|nr:LppX_LprAFG lipoprotein [Thermomicrobiales bacterium]